MIPAACRRALALLATLLLVLAAAACGSSSGSSSGDGCKWPSTTTPGAHGIALALDLDFHRLLAFDVSTGALVGECAPSGGNELPAAPFPFQAAGTVVVARGLQYLRPPVAGPSITAIPDNTTTETASGERVTDAGGVLDLASGTHRALRFRGWLVTTVLGERLLLQRYVADVAAPTSPSEWCVLPSVTAPRSACRPVAGAQGAGLPDVTPDGQLGWIPLAGRPLEIGSTPGYAAAGLGGLSGWADTRGGADGIVGADRQTVVFPTGLPGGAARLSWAHVSGETAVVHVSAYRNIGSYRLPDATGLAGAIGSADGSSVVLADEQGQVSRFDAAAQRHAVVQLRLPAGVHLGYLLTWPSTTAQS